MEDSEVLYAFCNMISGMVDNGRVSRILFSKDEWSAEIRVEIKCEQTEKES